MKVAVFGWIMLCFVLHQDSGKQCRPMKINNIPHSIMEGVCNIELSTQLLKSFVFENIPAEPLCTFFHLVPLGLLNSNTDIRSLFDLFCFAHLYVV